jgi:hypothetical protein
MCAGHTVARYVPTLFRQHLSTVRSPCLTDVVDRQELDVLLTAALAGRTTVNIKGR